MTSLQLLRDQKAALENEIARAIKLAEDKRRALEQQIARERAAEIAQGKAEIAAIMQKYNLSMEDAFGAAAPSAQKSGGGGKRSGYLSEIREYYSGRTAA